jgi:hypothetical protein
MRRDASGCTLDLPPNADRSVPFRSQLPFGILGGGGVIRFAVKYEPNLSCDDPSNLGWQPLSGSTVRICQGACSQPLYDGMSFDVTLVCGPDAAG